MSRCRNPQGKMPHNGLKPLNRIIKQDQQLPPSGTNSFDNSVWRSKGGDPQPGHLLTASLSGQSRTGLPPPRTVEPRDSRFLAVPGGTGRGSLALLKVLGSGWTWAVPRQVLARSLPAPGQSPGDGKAHTPWSPQLCKVDWVPWLSCLKSRKGTREGGYNQAGRVSANALSRSRTASTRPLTIAGPLRVWCWTSCGPAPVCPFPGLSPGRQDTHCRGEGQVPHPRPGCLHRTRAD